MKKVLAWAVALALVLSSFTMAFAADTANASQFKDASSINYTEAVDVMVATGVINGYPDGTFGPAKTVKRAEMAKMISVMLEGGEDIGDQFKGACPFADSKNHWAAGYIAYCASEHIIDGRSADVFDPEAEVTGTEVAKMALTALGYDSQIQGYVGENWAANVLKDAKKNDLFEGLNSDFVPADPCSREEAAQILFNCLQATMVEYNNNTTVEVGDAKVTVNSAVKDQTWPEGSTKDDNGNTTKELYEDAFGGDLHKTPSTSDDFGRPAHKWALEKDEIGTYPDAADSDAVAEEGQTVQEAVEDVNSDGKVDTVTLNGVEGYTGEIFAGDKVEMFETDTDDVYDVVITRYVLVEITSVDDNVTAKDVKKDKDLTAYVTLNNDNKYFDTKVAGYDADTYVEDTYIAVAFKGGAEVKGAEILDSYVADTEQGELTKWTKDAMTVGDEDYTFAGTYKDCKISGLVTDSNKTVGDTLDVYFDQNGYALGAFVAEAEEPLVAVFSDFTYKLSGSNIGDGPVEILPIDTVTLVDETGAENEYGLTNAGKKAASDAARYKNRLDLLVKYELTDNGKVKNIIFKNDEKEKSFGEITGTQEVSKRGLVDGKLLAEDVVAFYYSVDDTDSDDNEWIIYGYEDLLETTINATQKPAQYILNSDGEIAYLLLSSDVADNSANTVVGFFKEYSEFTDKDGQKATITVMLPDGTEETLTTDGKANYSIVTTADAKTLLKLTKNKDDEVTAVVDGYANLKASENGTVDGNWSDPQIGYIFGTQAGTAVADKVGDNNVLVNGKTIYVGDANVYKVVYDEDKKVDSLSKIQAKNINKGDLVVPMQLNKDSEDVIDTVLVFTAADQEMLATYQVTVAATENGKVSVNPTEGKEGAEITITATPDTDYVQKTVEVTYKVGNETQNVQVNDNKFIMPAADVTVTVTFGK